MDCLNDTPRIIDVCYYFGVTVCCFSFSGKNVLWSVNIKKLQYFVKIFVETKMFSWPVVIGYLDRKRLPFLQSIIMHYHY